nr:acyl carrier protein phosphodiesterase [Oscillatoria sp. FACHB-1406]
MEDYQNCYSAEILKGIATHRQIDCFTDRHPLYLQSRRLLGDRYFRFSGIIIDIAYDHFLSKHWQLFAASQLDDFVNDFYDNLQANRSILPPKARAIAPKVVLENWLASYQTLAGVNRTLARISRRLKRANPLATASEELAEHYEALEAGFLQFFPEAIAYAEILQKSPFQQPSSESALELSINLQSLHRKK